MGAQNPSFEKNWICGDGFPTSEKPEQQREREQRLNCFPIDFSVKQSYQFFYSAKPLPLSIKKQLKCAGHFAEMFGELPIRPTASYNDMGPTHLEAPQLVTLWHMT